MRAGRGEMTSYYAPKRRLLRKEVEGCSEEGVREERRR